VAPMHREGLKTLLQNLEVLLQNSEYFAGNELTIADFGFLANVATVKVKLLPLLNFSVLLMFLIFRPLVLT
jgi:glutathione S-transferase